MTDPTWSDKGRRQSANAHELENWWHDRASEEIERTIPKALEYGSGDLIEIGRQMAETMRIDQGRHLKDEVLAELGIYFYVVGKMARWTDAVKNGGRRVSDDTLFDIGVYIRMVQRIRAAGGWPGVEIAEDTLAPFDNWTTPGEPDHLIGWHVHMNDVWAVCRCGQWKSVRQLDDRVGRAAIELEYFDHLQAAGPRKSKRDLGNSDYSVFELLTGHYSFEVVDGHRIRYRIHNGRGGFYCECDGDRNQSAPWYSSDYGIGSPEPEKHAAQQAFDHIQGVKDDLREKGDSLAD